MNEKNEADGASSLREKESDAIDSAREMLQNTGGGELTVKGGDGKLRSKDTVAPETTRSPSREKEH